MRHYQPRLVDVPLTDLVAHFPAVSVTGPRAAGKTTTARQHAATTVRLDRDAEAAAFRADPDAALRELSEPILLDEWQEVPGVLGAVKRAVDADPRPGRFILTGSVRIDLDATTWPGTGRVIRLPMHVLTVRELQASTSARLFCDRLLDADGDSLQPSGSSDLGDYLELAMRGGFPEPALQLDAPRRTAWMDSYVDQLLTRDAASIEGKRDPERLRRFFEALALNSAGIVSDSTLVEVAGINAKTADAYERLLQNLLVIDAIPAWASNRLKRLIKASKRYLVDPAIMTSLLRMDRSALLRDGNLLGRTIETFVAQQMRPELSISQARARWYHLRDKGGRHEIDIVVEYGGGRICGIEIKATAAPDRADAGHLEWLRDEVGERFVSGVVLHTGPQTFELADRIFAAPISTIWA